MTVFEFFVVWLACLATMLACRCIPIFLLKGKDLPQNIQDGLNLIPPSAFAALVANDLFKPELFELGVWPSVVPLIAAAFVVVVAVKTRSLIWCAIAGVVAYAALTLL